LYDNIGHRFPVETFLTNASVGLPHGSNEIVYVSYCEFIPKLHFKFCLILLCITEQSEWEHD